MQQFNNKIRIAIHTKKNNSEDKNKIFIALSNIIELDYNTANNTIKAETSDYKLLENIYKILLSKQSIHIARKNLLKNVKNNSTYILFNKQAAMINSLVICENENESPLGPIKVEIQSDNITKFIDWFAPKHEVL